MKSKNRIKGLWWLSDDPDGKVSGELLIKEKRLDLNGYFNGATSTKELNFSSSSNLLSPKKDKTVLGVSIDDTKYTLTFFEFPMFDVSLTNEQRYDTYRLDTVIVGEHFNKMSDISFPNYLVVLPYLFEWMQDSVVNLKRSKSTKEITLKLGGFKDVKILENKDFKIFCRLELKTRPLSVSKDMRLQQRCVLCVKSYEKSINLLDIYRLINCFERFLSLAVGRSLTFTSLKAESEFSRIEIHPPFLKSVDYPYLHPMEMNFTFNDLENSVENILRNCVLGMEVFEDVLNLFSSVGKSEYKNLNNQYKDIISVIEGYYKIKNGYTGNDLNKVLKKTNEVMPKEQRLFSSNDINRIRITRNYLSHMYVEKEERKKILNTKEKYVIFHKLIFLFKYCFLKDIELKSTLIEKFYDKERRRLPRIKKVLLVYKPYLTRIKELVRKESILLDFEIEELNMENREKIGIPSKIGDCAGKYFNDTKDGSEVIIIKCHSLEDVDYTLLHEYAHSKTFEYQNTSIPYMAEILAEKYLEKYYSHNLLKNRYKKRTKSFIESLECSLECTTGDYSYKRCVEQQYERTVAVASFLIDNNLKNFFGVQINQMEGCIKKKSKEMDEDLKKRKKSLLRNLRKNASKIESSCEKF